MHNFKWHKLIFNRKLFSSEDSAWQDKKGAYIQEPDLQGKEA